MYQVFARTWWKRNPEWEGGREPCLGHKTKLCQVTTAEAARRECKDYNDTHKPGFLSRKAEYEEI